MPAAPENLRTPRTVRNFYDSLPELPNLHVEIINGRIVVSSVGTPDHGFKVTRMVLAFKPLVDRQGWDLYAATVGVVIVGSWEPVIPDLVVAPAEAPLQGARELRSDGLIMVGEIVEKESVEDDRKHKPGMYATGGVPLMLLVDPIADRATVTVYSEPKEGAYTHSAAVLMGETLHIPEPVDFTLDTSIFLE